MLLAELEVFHSRAVQPTRRVALGHLVLPVDPAPGLGGILLGAVVAEHSRRLDGDDLLDIRSDDRWSSAEGRGEVCDQFGEGGASIETVPHGGGGVVQNVESTLRRVEEHRRVSCVAAIDVLGASGGE